MQIIIIEEIFLSKKVTFFSSYNTFKHEIFGTGGVDIVVDSLPLSFFIYNDFDTRLKDIKNMEILFNKEKSDKFLPFQKEKTVHLKKEIRFFFIFGLLVIATSIVAFFLHVQDMTLSHQ